MERRGLYCIRSNTKWYLVRLYKFKNFYDNYTRIRTRNQYHFLGRNSVLYYFFQIIFMITEFPQSMKTHCGVCVCVLFRHAPGFLRMRWISPALRNAYFLIRTVMRGVSKRVQKYMWQSTVRIFYQKKMSFLDMR